ncbi:MAG: DMT family transporter [Chitinophagaceae bacterium]
MKHPLLQLHLAVFLWGFTGVLGRVIQLNEGLLVWYRIVITVLSLFFILLVRKKLEILPVKQVFNLLAIGSIIALHWVFFYGSIKYANVSIALTCLSSAGLFTAILEPIFSKSKINLKEVLLSLMGILGILLIFHFDPSYQTGIVIGIISTLLSVIFSILNKQVVTKFQASTVMLYELSGGLLFLTLLMPIYLSIFPTKKIIPNVNDWFWLILLSWICTLGAMHLSLSALRKVSVFTQNLTLNLEPIYGIILAFIVYEENKYLGFSFYVGFTLIFLSVIIQMWRITKNSRKV